MNLFCCWVIYVSVTMPCSLFHLPYSQSFAHHTPSLITSHLTHTLTLFTFTYPLLSCIPDIFLCNISVLPKWQTLVHQTYTHIQCVNNKKYWWYIPIKIAIQYKHNKPDTIFRDEEGRELKSGIVSEASCPTSVNISSKIRRRRTSLVNKWRTYSPSCRYSFLPNVIGALGHATINLNKKYVNTEIFKKQQSKCESICEFSFEET